MSERQVMRLIQELEDIEELFVNRRDGPYSTNMYLLLLVSKGKFPNPDIDRAGDKLSLVTSCHHDKPGPQMSPNPSGTVTEEEEEVHTPAEWPSLEEVLQVAIEYPGSVAKGIPAIIPKPWAEYHFHVRTFEKESWSRRWRTGMVSLFEMHWQAGQDAARGIVRQVSSGRPGYGVQKKNPLGRERGEILQQMAYARKNGKSTAELERELKELH
jgi:hypothetical protein